MKIHAIAAVLSVAALTATGTPAVSSAAKGPDAASLLPYTGIYSLDPHHDLAISLRRFAGQSVLVFSDLKTDAIRVLFPGGPDRFVAGREMLRPEPHAWELEFRRDASGEVTGMLAGGEEPGEKRLAAKKPIPTEEVRFKSGDLDLAGTLFLPGGSDRPYPLAVLANGSEDNDRYSFDALPFALALHGVAAFAYDKRGTGTSSGSWEDASIEDLAEDLVAALNALAKRPDINPARMGVIGFSEGGWVAPKAASLTPSIKFIVSISGGAFTKGYSFLHKYRVQFAADGLTGEALDKAMAEKTAIVEASERRVRENDHPSGFDRRITYDPEKDWKSFKGAVLYMVGDSDILEPGAESARRLNEILTGAGNTDFTIRLFPRAHHGLFVAKDGTPAEFRSMKGISRLVPGYWDILLGWVEDRAGRGC